MRIDFSCLVYSIYDRVRPACKRPFRIDPAFKSTMSRPFIAFNFKERAEIAIIILSHHLVCYYAFWRMLTNCKPRYYPDFDIHIICKTLYCNFFLWQEEYAYLSVFYRRIIFSVGAAVRAFSYATEFFHLFSSMHCNSMLPRGRSS